MVEIEDAVYKFYGYLNSKYMPELPKKVKIFIYDNEILEADGCQFHARTQDYDDELQLLIAGRSPYGPLLPLAHEYCHLLQMYTWKTWPDGLEHLSQDDLLEEQARSFAEEEVNVYAEKTSGPGFEK